MSGAPAGDLTPRLDALPPPQRHLWPELAPTSRLGLVLYGGTAIALRLGHRTSVDFDFFTDRPLDKAALRAALPCMAEATTIQDASDTLSVLVPGQHDGESPVKLSFFGSLGFGRTGTPQLTDDGVLHVASVQDLLATKLKVLLQRVEARDYRDIEALLGAGLDLATGLAAAQALYGNSFQPSECLKALVYFEGGDLHALAPSIRDELVRAVRSVREIPVMARVSGSLTISNAAT